MTVTVNCVCVFITAVPIIKLFAWGDGLLEDIFGSNSLDSSAPKNGQ